MKIISLVIALSSFGFAAEKSKGFKETVSTGAKNIENETRNLIKKGKDVASGKKKIRKNEDAR